MMQQYFRSSEEEQGAVLILVVFVIIIMFAMAGLAVDAGNLFHAKLQLQKAVDTGALAGIGSTFIEKDAPVDNQEKLKEFIEEKAKETVVANLTAEGVSIEIDDIFANYISEDHTLFVKANFKQKFLLMNAVPFNVIGLPGAGKDLNIEASAEIKRKPANVSLVLDLSDSMDCPSRGDCICKTPARNGTETCDELAFDRGVNRRIVDLRTAVADFINQFDPTYDRINLAGFKLGSELITPLKDDGSRGFDVAAFDSFYTIDPSSSTNPSDGLITAYSDYREKGIAGNEEVAYVLFSDGAPTAGRFLFSSPKDLDLSEEYGQGLYDYLNYIVEWQDTVTGDSWSGPSPLVKAHGSVAWDQSTSAAPPGFVPSCVKSLPSHVPVSSPSEFNNVFSDCLNNMGFHPPGAPEKIYGSDISDTGPKTYENNWREQYYNNTVAISDFIRENKGYVFSIGLGDQRDLRGDITKNDPYQELRDVLLRKDILLARTANDIIQARPVDDSGEPIITNHHPDFVFQGSLPYDDIKNSTQPRYGRYYPTPNAEDLHDIFRSISQKILLRITK